jgi:EamA domain-containing membrane protein RarD
MNDFGYYALVLVVLVVGLFVLKKVATCMIKALFAAVVAVLRHTQNIFHPPKHGN